MNVRSIIEDGIRLGLKNFLSLLGTVLLYVVTCWIPYLNVGTTIAMISLPAAMSRGEVISPSEIFDAKYRNNMGNFFLLSVFYFMALVIGFLFLVIPGIVLSYAWFIAFLLLVDKQMEPLQALAESNKRTFGKKRTIFLAFLALGLVYLIAYMLVGMIFGGGGFDMYYDGYYDYNWGRGSLATLLSLALTMLYIPIQMGCQAVVYRELTADMNS